MTTTEKPGWSYRWVGRGQYTFAQDHHTVEFYADTPADSDHLVGALTFQDGPVREHGYNGTTNEQVIQMLIDRLEALNQPPYKSSENDRAISFLKGALAELNARTRSRENRGVEGTSTP